MRFIDEATVKVKGGDGGDGLISWRREKFIPMGGPDGGDGGNGGAVIFQVDSGLNTLIDFSFNKILKAENGGRGGDNGKTGRDGENLICKVPLGTQVFYKEKLVADLSDLGACWVAARGGRGGKGNAFFKTSTRQAPKFAQKGVPGDDLELHLVLKSVADVGLVGFPNVGKSTLVSAITASSPKVADYPFTTVRPSLGVVVLSNERRFVIADIPGLIAGAHEGKGLGLQFLRHIERTTVLAHVIDVSINIKGELIEDISLLSDEDILSSVQNQFETIEQELRQFSEELVKRKRLIVFSKGELEENMRAFKASKDFFSKLALESVLISSRTKLGLDELKEKLYELIKQAKM